MLKAATFLAMAEPKKALLKEFKTAVSANDLAKVREILAEVGKGAKGRYKMAQDDGFVALGHVRTLVNDRSDNGRTPLHDAVSPEMKALLIENGADRNREDLNGMRSDMDELGDALERFPIMMPLIRRGGGGIRT